jgi:hypothetical protein
MDFALIMHELRLLNMGLSPSDLVDSRALLPAGNRGPR